MIIFFINEQNSRVNNRVFEKFSNSVEDHFKNITWNNSIFCEQLNQEILQTAHMFLFLFEKNE